MEKIKKFISDLVQVEQNAHTEYRKRDNMSGYNDAFDYLMSFTHDGYHKQRLEDFKAFLNR